MLESLGHHDEASAVMSVAVRVYPTSMQLWLLRLSMVAEASAAPASQRSSSSSSSSNGSSCKAGSEAGGLEELDQLCREALGHIPANVSKLFNIIMWKSRQVKANIGPSTMSIIRMYNAFS